ncbi:helix-turn-helix transcriptional regulator [Candidatus Nomurabacteria bacterium]|uniref:Helix-turn-helix transcriptional regulator n=1 Tax=candidate division WWE3 bacterium TaxID=2053526 RepID=A0A955E172_UNCKA|nr:helix-turn-helix transcriptional regulator [candidate division WWE3 bacterium]MCB9823752.1 helix-turn-helix transcriptional regulator [Candidatus Nomurabacteria bacterium]MCB9826842.1 helix-turn-helix transcriptional regulator [Candidatus Nomurabacteria bacterium]MCB9827547.1 helix-turn-helix transcriptional regulator [Candidatus Nomurabacteria bacterium]HXK52428.1 helix-turn-helix transcriptional regulator [bacterium]
MLSYKIGKKIKKVRVDNKLSQRRFGEKIGLSAKTISAYECGRISPPYHVLEQISHTYNAVLVNPPIAKIKFIEKQLEVLEQALQTLKTELRQF